MAQSDSSGIPVRPSPACRCRPSGRRDRARREVQRELELRGSRLAVLGDERPGRRSEVRGRVPKPTGEVLDLHRCIGADEGPFAGRTADQPELVTNPLVAVSAVLRPCPVLLEGEGHLGAGDALRVEARVPRADLVTLGVVRAPRGHRRHRDHQRGQLQTTSSWLPPARPGPQPDVGHPDVARRQIFSRVDHGPSRLTDGAAAVPVIRPICPRAPGGPDSPTPRAVPGRGGPTSRSPGTSERGRPRPAG